MQARHTLNNHWLLFPLWLVIQTMVVLSGCSPDHPAMDHPEPRTVPVPILLINNQAIDKVYTTAGTVVSDARVEVTSRISGYIRDISVQEGQTVKRGDLLVVLDDSDVEGAILQAHAALAQAEAAYKDARTDALRYETLFHKGSTSDNVLRKARLQRDLTMDGANLAQTGLETALAQRAYVNILSPVDGIVVDKMKRTGDLATPGKPILIVESADILLFETYVAESRVRAMQPGDRVDVLIDALGKSRNGTIARLVPSGDSLTRRYLVKISFPNHVGLLPGMFGRAAFIVGREYEPVIPKSAIITRAGLQGVFLVREDMTVRFRWIRTGREWPDRMQVKAGLQAGEQIVGNGGDVLREGDRVISEEQQ